MPKLILDASIIISWGVELNDSVIYDKLREAEFEHLIPKNVADEVVSKNSVTEHIFNHSEIVKCERNRFEELSSRYFRLGSGELAVLTIGVGLSKDGDEYFCVLDDKLAREAADKLELEYIGAIGLLGILVEQKLIDFERAEELIRIMKDRGTRLPDNHTELLKKII